MATLREKAENTTKIIVDSLVQRRKELGLSQSKVAALMGVTQQNVAKLEKGDNPTLNSVCLYAAAVKSDIYAIGNEHYFKYVPPTVKQFLESDSDRGSEFTLNDILSNLDKDELEEFEKDKEHLKDYIWTYENTESEKLDLSFSLYEAITAMKALLFILENYNSKFNTQSITTIFDTVSYFEELCCELDCDFEDLKDLVENIKGTIIR